MAEGGANRVKHMFLLLVIDHEYEEHRAMEKKMAKEAATDLGQGNVILGVDD